MASDFTSESFLVLGIDGDKRSYEVEVTDLGGKKKWIPDDLTVGSSIYFREGASSQNWTIKRDKTSVLWSFHVKSGGKKLYVSYNDNGAVRLEPRSQGDENSENQEYERFFNMFLDDYGGLFLTARNSDKTFLGIQQGILTMHVGTAESETSEMSSEQVQEEDICSSGFGASCKASPLGGKSYLVEVNDPDISGRRWSILDPIPGNNVLLVDSDSQYWTVRISDAGESWTFQPRYGTEYYASSEGNDVKFERGYSPDITRQFTVRPFPGTHGIFINPRSKPEKFVGKNGRILRALDYHLAIGWNLRVTHFIFYPRDHMTGEIIFPDLEVGPPIIPP